MPTPRQFAPEWRAGSMSPRSPSNYFLGVQ